MSFDLLWTLHGVKAAARPHFAPATHTDTLSITLPAAKISEAQIYSLIALYDRTHTVEGAETSLPTFKK